MKKRISFIPLLTLLVALLAGCGGGKTYEDGTHYRESEFDERGWKSTLTLTVKNGKISEVTYDEVDNKGISKTTNPEYAQAMKEEEGVTPQEAFNTLSKELLSTQDINEVDAVSGATTSSELFKKLVEDAIAVNKKE